MMTSSEALHSPKAIRLRYAGQCRVCARELPAGSLAICNRESKSLTCLDCAPEHSTPSPETATPIAAERSTESRDAADESDPADPEVFAGVAGASARRENERRKQARETRIRRKHPLVGGLLLALVDDPQSTKAWATGADGEERLGRRLDKLVGDGTHVLHDRRIPRTKANIDHIVVSPSRAFVIDAKKYQGRPSLRVQGGLIRPRIETLMVGSRDCTKQADGVHKQVGLVTAALQSAELGHIPVAGMLCFVEADWPLLGGDFTIDGVSVLWPKKAAMDIVQSGGIDAPRRALSIGPWLRRSRRRETHGPCCRRGIRWPNDNDVDLYNS